MTDPTPATPATPATTPATPPAGDGINLASASAVLGASDDRFRHDYLEVRGLHVEFDGFVAVDSVDLTVVQGDLRFLIGPNGAGKTTIVDAITGLAKASGSVRFGGTELLGRKVHRVARAGVGRTFQTASVFEELTVLQNLDIAAGAARGPRELLRRRGSAPENVEAAMETIGLTHLRDVQAGILAHGQKQWLEIGMLLVQDARLLLLDEPVAGMSHAEREQTGLLLQRIGDQRTVVVVEHDMEFLRAFASSVTVLHMGSVLSEGTYAEVQADPRVQEVYLGTAGAARGARRSRPASGTAAAPALPAAPGVPTTTTTTEA
ncbi:urea ABC transporter ATP-binding protein UrtD [Sanguibacter suarezii]|uniref:urea ABC transporter ATP-binding protein UrtD n=1 Tax=Sanguibacter suarezii TaxID=60921 RepID=UPI000A046683|nr:urea ABC transporter ATP-binding protein UrtD [Sanguibacter suarezii]